MKREMDLALNVGIVKKINDRSRYLDLNPLSGYNTIFSAIYYDGNLTGFINNANFAKSPKVTFSGALTYFGISRGITNIIDTPKKVIVSDNGSIMVTPTANTGMTNGDTCLVQTNISTIFILDAR